MARRFFGRRVKAPVFSRLSLAWAGTAALCAGAAIVVLSNESGPAVTIALAGEPAERMAPPPERLGQPARLASVEAATPELSGPSTRASFSGASSRTASSAASRAAPVAFADKVAFADQLDEGVSIRAEDFAPQNNPESTGESPGEDGRLTNSRQTKSRRLVSIDEDTQHSGWTSTDDMNDAYNNDAAYDATGGEILITVDGKPAKSIAKDSKGGRRATTPKPIAAVSPDLRRKTAYGSAPGIARSGARASEVYAYRFRPNENPNVALIVGGLGLDRDLTRRAIDELPAAVSLAFAPYAKDLAFWTARAREAGHEILLELPMEHGQKSKANLGPAALLTSRAREENLQRLDWLLSRFEGYMGATNYLGAQFSGDRTAMTPVLARLRASGLAYFDDTGAVLRYSDTAARDVASVSRVIPPNSGDPAADFALLERIAQRDGLSLGKAYAAAGVFDELSAWAWSLEEKQLTLAPASAVFALQKSEL